MRSGIVAGGFPDCLMTSSTASDTGSPSPFPAAILTGFRSTSGVRFSVMTAIRWSLQKRKLGLFLVHRHSLLPQRIPAILFTHVSLLLLRPGEPACDQTGLPVRRWLKSGLALREATWRPASEGTSPKLPCLTIELEASWPGPCNACSAQAACRLIRSPDSRRPSARSGPVRMAGGQLRSFVYCSSLA